MFYHSRHRPADSNELLTVMKYRNDITFSVCVNKLCVVVHYKHVFKSTVPSILVVEFFAFRQRHVFTVFLTHKLVFQRVFAQG